MVSVNTSYHFFALILISVLFSGCTTVPSTVSPTEDRSSSSDPSVHLPSKTDKMPEQRINITQQPILDEKQATLPSTRKQQVVPIPKSSNQVKPSNPAVLALLDNAQSQKNQGDIYAAQSSVQRAQRISPNDPNVYFALATIHRDLNDYGLAEQVALKGVSIVRGQAPQLKRFWLLIAEIRTLAGNKIAAQQAKAKANEY